MYNNKYWILNTNLNILWLLMDCLILCYVLWFFLNIVLTNITFKECAPDLP